MLMSVSVIINDGVTSVFLDLLFGEDAFTFLTENPPEMR